MKPKEVLGLLKDSEAKFVDFRFTDTKGKEQQDVRRFVDLWLEGYQ